MGIIIKPYSHDSCQTPFADLDQNQYGVVCVKLTRILAESFVTDERRRGRDYRLKVHTQAEERRRGEILIRWFRIMREDLGWTVQQSLDLLPRALRDELDGRTYEPPPRNRLWTPEGVQS